MSYSLDVETFINEIKKHPEIWDLNCEDNRHKSRKQRAWTEVARLFIADFDEMGEGDKNDVYRKLHGKWRNIRDSFVRHIKRNDGKKGYMYAKNLSFLNTLYSNAGSEVEAEAENDSSSTQLWESDDDRKVKIKRQQYNVLNETNWSDEEPPSTIENLKRKRVSNVKTEDVNVEFVNTPFTDNFSMDGDDDRSFFESLLPAVREFNLDQKLDFRSQVLNLIKSIRNTSKSNNTQQIFS